MVCDDCRIDYPEGLVSRFTSTHGDANVCGICALARRNGVHGTNLTQLEGPVAESLRIRALKFRQEQLGPKLCTKEG